MDFSRILNGMIRAARFDKDFYEEVEQDTSYGQDALIVVILAALAGGIGVFFGSILAGYSLFSSLLGLVGGIVRAAIIYFAWVFVAQYVGTRFFKGTGDFGEVQRAFGFAYAPQVLNILSFLSFVPVIKCVAWVIPLLVMVWSIATGFVAIRQSLDQDDTNAAFTMIVSFIAVIVIWVIVSIPLRLLGLS
jgi:hypothetical protein